MTRARSALALALLPACVESEARQVAAPRSGAGVEVEGGGHQHRPAPAPERLRRWPILEAWLGGADAPRVPTQSPFADEADLAAAGRGLFALYCANCHGPEGRGDGPRSAVFDPPPRDLTRGVFKFRSTPSGAAPTAEDLFRTVSGGLRGTGMMPFADLPEQERWALVAYVQSLAPRREEAAPLDAPAPAAMDARPRVARGRRVWERLRCGECHGARGCGDGPAAAGLRDDLGRLVRSPDFATRPPKRGGDAASLYLTMVTGLDGTPMPSYADALAAADAWDLVAYVRSLASRAPGEVDPRDLEEARLLIDAQHAQGKHAVVGGCGCQARRRDQAQ